MSLRSEPLDEALLANRRRLNADRLRAKLRAVRIHGRLNEAGDLMLLRDFASSGAREIVYYSNWMEAAPHVVGAVSRLDDQVFFAPYNFEEAGIARVAAGSFSEAFFANPLKFDLDGFWIADAKEAILIDFDDDQLSSELTWKRFSKVPR